MYKIFINEKPLTISDTEIKGAHNIIFESGNTIKEAINILVERKKEAVNIYSSDKETLWETFQEYIPPVYAAGGLVKNNENKYLFIKRNGKWDLPKGHVEEGETYEETALREVEEECSISGLQLGDFITTTYHIYYNKAYWLKVVYWYEMETDEKKIPTPQTEENIEIADWFSKEEIPALMKNTYKNIEELVTAYFNILS